MYVTDRFEAVQYDGTNGAYIAGEFLTNTTLDSDDGELLSLTDGTNDPRVRLGQWVIRQAVSVGQFQFRGVYSDADFQVRYAPLP
ncbi:hypothetical protein [Streptomyces longwoodensis]|uniref:hypothetical protein n=1 Tax=Streptomyces longwoodensis TaxID=68231 RepID=UPI0036C80701